MNIILKLIDDKIRTMIDIRTAVIEIVSQHWEYNKNYIINNKDAHQEHCIVLCDVDRATENDYKKWDEVLEQNEGSHLNGKKRLVMY